LTQYTGKYYERIDLLLAYNKTKEIQVVDVESWTIVCGAHAYVVVSH